MFTWNSGLISEFIEGRWSQDMKRAEIFQWGVLRSLLDGGGLALRRETCEKCLRMLEQSGRPQYYRQHHQKILYNMADTPLSLGPSTTRKQEMYYLWLHQRQRVERCGRKAVLNPKVYCQSLELQINNKQFQPLRDKSNSRLQFTLHMSTIAHQTLPLQVKLDNQDERYTRSIELCQGILPSQNNLIKSTIPIKEYSNKFLRERWVRNDLMPLKTKIDPQKRFNVILRKKQKISKCCPKEKAGIEDKILDCMRKENQPTPHFFPFKTRSRFKTEAQQGQPMREMENQLLLETLPSNLLTPYKQISKHNNIRRQHQGQFTPLPHTKRISQSKGLEKVRKQFAKSVSQLRGKSCKDQRSYTFSPQNFETKKILPTVKKNAFRDIKRITHNSSVRCKAQTEPGEEDFQLNGWQTNIA